MHDTSRQTGRSDDGASWDDGVLDDHSDAVSDPKVIPLCLLHTILVDELAVGPNAGVLVDDGPLYDRVGANAHGQAAGHEVALLRALVVVAAHDERVLDVAVFAYDGAHTKHSVGYVAARHDDATITKHALFNLGVKDLAGRQVARHGVDGRRLVVEPARTQHVTT